MNRWKNQFNVHNIKSFTQKDDGVGLETEVVLAFKSGTRKRIVFRTAENQHEAFLDLITRSVATVQPS